jgi:hypothetical protein
VKGKWEEQASKMSKKKNNTKTLDPKQPMPTKGDFKQQVNPRCTEEWLRTERISKAKLEGKGQASVEVKARQGDLMKICSLPRQFNHNWINIKGSRRRARSEQTPDPTQHRSEKEERRAKEAQRSWNCFNCRWPRSPKRLSPSLLTNDHALW